LDEDQLFEVEKILKTLGQAIEAAEREDISTPPSDYVLEGEKTDETARRSLAFGKHLILSVRNLLRSLDSKSIAELRSYKKPPKSIHLILKGALYIFGHTPKESKEKYYQL